MLNEFLFFYLDDILIFSEMKKKHVENVWLVLQHLLENKTFIKAEECDFHTTSFAFLRFIVGQGQLSTDPAKVSAVADWPTLASHKWL